MDKKMLNPSPIKRKFITRHIDVYVSDFKSLKV